MEQKQINNDERISMQRKYILSLLLTSALITASDEYVLSLVTKLGEQHNVVITQAHLKPFGKSISQDFDTRGKHFQSAVDELNDLVSRFVLRDLTCTPEETKRLTNGTLLGLARAYLFIGEVGYDRDLFPEALQCANEVFPNKKDVENFERLLKSDDNQRVLNRPLQKACRKDPVSKVLARGDELFSDLSSDRSKMNSEQMDDAWDHCKELEKTAEQELFRDLLIEGIKNEGKCPIS